MVMANVGILTALVLGLLIASAKTNFDTMSNEIKQFAVDLSLLDRELVRLGGDAQSLRGSLHAFAVNKIALTWRTDPDKSTKLEDSDTDQVLEDMEERLRANFQPQTLRDARASALQILGDIKRTNGLLTVQGSVHTPAPFLAVVIFWLGMLYLSYAVFAPLKKTVVAAMLVSAISVSIALNVIVDMDRPFVGFVKASSSPIRQALDRMAP